MSFWTTKLKNWKRNWNFYNLDLDKSKGIFKKKKRNSHVYFFIQSTKCLLSTTRVLLDIRDGLNSNISKMIRQNPTHKNVTINEQTALIQYEHIKNVLRKKKEWSVNSVSVGVDECFTLEVTQSWVL